MNESRSLIYVTAVDTGGQDYTKHVQETRGGVSKALIKSAILAVDRALL